MRLLKSIRSRRASRSGIILAVVFGMVLGTTALAFAAPALLDAARDEQSSVDPPPETGGPPAETEEPGPEDGADSGEGDQNPDESTSGESQEGSGSDEQVDAQATASCMGEAATMEGTDDGEVINGTDERDVIVAGEGNDTVDSRGGDDVVCGGDGDGDRTDDFVDDDNIRSGSGDDRVDGQLGNDRIRGGDGDDTLFGDGEESGERSMLFSTADEIDGGEGEDVLDGGVDQDVVLGSEDSDSIESSADDESIDVVIGGRSSDQCSADDDDDVSECEGADTVETPDSDEAGGGGGGGNDGVNGRSGGGNGRSGGNGNDGDNDLIGPAESPFLPPSCLSQTARAGRLGIGGLFLGGNVLETLVGAGELPLPLPPRRSLNFCIEGGGVTLVAFSLIGRAEVILWTGPGRSARGVNPGDPPSAIRRSYPNALLIESPATHSGARLYRASRSSRIIFGARDGRVVFVGMASRAALADGDLLAEYLRQIPLPREI